MIHATVTITAADWAGVHHALATADHALREDQPPWAQYNDQNWAMTASRHGEPEPVREA